MDFTSHIDFQETLIKYGPVTDKSKVLTTCPVCREQRTTTFRCVKRAVRRHGDCLCASCRARAVAPDVSKAMWRNPEYRDSQRAGCLAHWSDVARADQSSRSRRMWADESYRAKQIEALAARMRNGVFRAKFVESMRRLWSDKSFRDRIGSSGRNRDRLSEAMKRRWQSEWGAGMRMRLASADSRLFKSDASKRLWQDASYRERQRSGFHCALETMLTDPSYRAMLSAAGKKPWQDDARSEFLNSGAVRQKIFDALHASGNASDLHDFDLKQVRIERLDDLDEARVFLGSFHYGQFGRAPKCAYGAFIDGSLIAVCKFAPPVRKEVATSMGMSHRDIAELDRMCIHPNRHKRNFASWFVARCCREFFSKFPAIKRLVSFADTTHGHHGTVYLASGWTRIADVAPDYYYVGSDGWVMHKKTLYGHACRMGMREREYADKHGYVRVMGKAKVKFKLDR